ncbi:hypothetical protein LBW89_12170 [Paenibacillus sp. alder61]|uniref:Uncharacterized protein n=1 Tax=Paenibacillus faecis TaxID=862114 RepID=A0A5D0CZE7_9BACL|nr:MULTISPECIES: hypothetical protein [Paenibacillus]MCA1293774.1 hypothetical protein [Paenibacillus sp. alder61]TYA15361.1 hypothetical protein FRY98_06970 [Paenibacillus faecis]
MKNKELEKIEKRNFWKDETGDIGVKQIAITVAVIVVVAFIVTTLKNGLLEKWIEEVWKFLFDDLIKGKMGGTS